MGQPAHSKSWWESERSCRGEIANDDDLPVCKQKQLLSPNVKFDLNSIKTRIPIVSDGNSASAAARYPRRPCHPKTSPGSPDQQRLQIWFRTSSGSYSRMDNHEIEKSKYTRANSVKVTGLVRIELAKAQRAESRSVSWQTCSGCESGSTLSTAVAGQAYSLKIRIEEAEVTVGKWCSTWCIETASFWSDTKCCKFVRLPLSPWIGLVEVMSSKMVEPMFSLSQIEEILSLTRLRPLRHHGDSLVSVVDSSLRNCANPLNISKGSENSEIHRIYL